MMQAAMPFESNNLQFHMYDLDGLAAETVREVTPADASKAMLLVEAFGIDRRFELD